ncbi:MAG: glycosyltransferase family 4 protein [Candidatus Micrarchaeia archaeon]
MQKPVIVQAVHAFPPSIGGIETHVLALSRAMVAQGAQVIVHTSTCANSQSIDLPLKDEGILVKRHFFISLPGFSSTKIIPFLCIHLMLENASVYCSHGFGAFVPFQASLAALLKRKKFFWTIHGVPKFSGAKKIFLSAYSLVATIPLAISKKLICVSESARENLPLFAQKKCKIIPNGISVDFFASEPGANNSKSGFKIIFVGRLDESKGVWLLLHSFEQFYFAHKDSTLCFIGSDEGTKQKMQQFAKEKSLPVSFESLPVQEMSSAYASASLTVLPSQYEGFGLAVFESWACGTPAISTPVGAIPSFYQDAFGADSQKFIFKDEKELLQKLEDIHQMSTTQIFKYAKNAKTALKQYRWEKIAKDTLELFNLQT